MEPAPSDRPVTEVQPLRWGTSSFSEKSWVGPFYPPGTKPRDFLTYYATQFDTVEVDATYYAVPDATTVEGWERKVPDDFTLSAKFPRSIVHCGERATPDPAKVLVPEHVRAETGVFLERMRILGGKCGPLVLQFPWFSRRAPIEENDFLDRLGRYLSALPRDFRYGVEVRNRGWVGEPLLDLLREHHVAFVLVEIANMPHPADLAERLDVYTTNFTYARLIGDRKAVDRETKTFDRAVLDKDASLLRWASLLQTAQTRTSEIYVYSNNHYAGHGPATTRRLKDLVGG
jgi:uncharacterized protein YecE (DUF72 family)